MNRWNLATPKFVVSGRGSVSLIPSLLNEINYKSCFVVIDPMVRQANTVGTVLEIFSNYFDDFTTNPTFSQVDAAVKIFKTERYDSIIAIGGGSAIDLAKIVGMVAENGGEAEVYFSNKIEIVHSTPIVAVPTTCGTGSEGSPYAVITNPDYPRKRGIEHPLLIPQAVILDPELLLTLEKTMIAATGMDTFAHLLESHISKKSNILTKTISIGLISSLRASLEKAVMVKDLESLEKLQSIAFSARLLYPRTGLSIAHALSHPLGAYTGLHHGLAVAILLEASMKYNYPHCVNSVKEVEISMGLEGRDGLFTWMHTFIEESGIKAAAAKDLGSIHDLPIERIASEALQSSNIPSNPRKVSLEAACSIVEESLSNLKE